MVLQKYFYDRLTLFDACAERIQQIITMYIFSMVDIEVPFLWRITLLELLPVEIIHCSLFYDFNWRAESLNCIFSMFRQSRHISARALVRQSTEDN